MVEEAAKKELFDAATRGEVATFQHLLQQNRPYLLDEVSFARSRNLLHVATASGRASIVEELLKASPQLARDEDSRKSSPLHIAAAMGHVEIARKLLSVAPDMCWSRDSQGMNPVHIAAANGHVGILDEMLRLDLLPAMERVRHGQTVLHLCVKRRQLTALIVLVEKMDGDIVCAKDDDGETLLHLAVRCHQLETIRYLLENTTIKKGTSNSRGRTALDIFNERNLNTTHDYSEMERILTSTAVHPILQILPKLNEVTMVVVVLIATMAFQAAVSPPGGVWQEDTPSHRAGEAVMATTHPKIYKNFVHANTTAFISSLVTIFLITTGLPSLYLIFLAIALYAMWVSLASIAVSYGAAIKVITPSGERQSLRFVILTVVGLSLIIIMLIAISATIESSYSLWKSKKRRQEDLSREPVTVRVLYRVYEVWHQRKNLTPNLRPQTIFPCLLGRSDAPSINYI